MGTEDMKVLFIACGGFVGRGGCLSGFSTTLVVSTDDPSGSVELVFFPLGW